MLKNTQELLDRYRTEITAHIDWIDNYSLKRKYVLEMVESINDMVREMLASVGKIG